MLFGGALLLLFAVQDFFAQSNGLSEQEIEIFLKTANNQPGENTTTEDFMEFQNEVQASHAWQLRAIGLVITGLGLGLGATFCFKGQLPGLKIAGVTSGIGLITSVWASMSIKSLAQAHLGANLHLTYSIWVFLFGGCHAFFVAIASYGIISHHSEVEIVFDSEAELGA